MNPTHVVWIVIHSRSAELTDAAHAFGPFAGLAELAAWQEELPDGDTCLQVVIPMVVPDSAKVIVIGHEDAVGA